MEPTEIAEKQFLLSNSRVISTILGVEGLNLPSSSPEPVNSFGAQSSRGEAQFSFEGNGPGMPLRGAGPALYYCSCEAFAFFMGLRSVCFFFFFFYRDIIQ